MTKISTPQTRQSVVTSTLELETPLKMDISSIAMQEKNFGDELSEAITTGGQVGAVMFILDSEGSIKYTTNKFILNNVGIQLKERVQILEAFNSTNVTFFDAAVRVYTFSASTLDYASQDTEFIGKYFHQSSIIKMYDKYLRASKLVETDSVAVIKFMNHTIYGYPVLLNVGYNSSVDKMAQFTMQFVVTKHTLDWIGVVNDDELEDLYKQGKTVFYSGLNNIYDNIYKTVFLKEYKSLPKDNTFISLQGMSNIIMNENFKDFRNEFNVKYDSLLNILIEESKGNTVNIIITAAEELKNLRGNEKEKIQALIRLFNSLTQYKFAGIQ